MGIKEEKSPELKNDNSDKKVFNESKLNIDEKNIILAYNEVQDIIINKSENLDEYINNIKVARRGLHLGGITLPKKGIFAHSGVIVETNKNNTYLLKFMDTNEVISTKLDSENMKVIKIMKLILTTKLQLIKLKIIGLFKHMVVNLKI